MSNEVKYSVNENTDPFEFTIDTGTFAGVTYIYKQIQLVQPKPDQPFKLTFDFIILKNENEVTIQPALFEQVIAQILAIYMADNLLMDDSNLD